MKMSNADAAHGLTRLSRAVDARNRRGDKGRGGFVFRVQGSLSKP